MAINQNIVIVARQFQPALIGEYFLIKNGIVREGGIYGPKISTDQFSNASTANFDLLVMPDKATFSIKEVAPIPEVIVAIKKFVESVPDPRFSAVGINFGYQIAEGVTDFATWTRDRFRPKSPIVDLSGDEALWGTNVHLRAVGGIMRLQVLPGFSPEDADQKPTMVLADFNYHFKLDGTENARKTLSEVLDKFNEASQHSCKIRAALMS